LLGGPLLRLLLAGGHETRCLLRPGSPNATRIDADRVEIRRGDVLTAIQVDLAPIPKR